MLKRLLFPSCLSRHLNPSCKPSYKLVDTCRNSVPSSPFRWLSSLVFSRSFTPFRVCAMADDGTFHTASSEVGLRSNRLAAEHSPYLLQHAHNPVDWQPWGEEAFSEARERDVPIFLSIGYSTCHWCHVMEVESFENEEVAKLLNDWFVSIKVDREERPDIDKVYMTYVQALHGSGGWPLSVFLSPDLKPLVGGTYFPPDDKFGRPGFKTVLRRVREAWDTNRDTLVQSGTFAIEQLLEALSATARSDKVPAGLSEKALQKCVKQLADSFDPRYGGFGSAPKFPRPVEIQLMMYHSKKAKENGTPGEAEECMGMVILTLQCMARGGVHDHIGGGFHRYSVDECWHVPHFEKMLYDQGQLVRVYLDAFSLTNDVAYSNVARDILCYLTREMIGPSGEIYSAEDADSAESEGASSKKEGAFYVWTSQEVDDILGEHANLFKEHYYIKPSGNCDLSRMSDPHSEFKGKNVLIKIASTSAMSSKSGMSIEWYLEILGICRQKLFDVRSKRPRPHLDDKPQEYMEVAEKAAAFIRTNLYEEKTQKLQHSFRNGPSQSPGFLDDYAFLISALLDLYEFGSSISWLSWAIELQHTQDALFLDEEGGGYFNTSGEDPSVLLRVKEDHDGAEPSGNSVSLINLVRLASLVNTGSDYYRSNGERLLAVFEKRLKETAMVVPLMCCGADMLNVSSRKQVVIVGNRSSSVFESMLAAAHASYDPNKTVIHVDPSDEHEMRFWEMNNDKIPLMAISNYDPDKVVALVCRDFVCSPPVDNPVSLPSLLSK